MAVDNCKNRNPLKRSGTAQEKRYPTFLNPDLVKIDGKTAADYERIVLELAKITQYYDGSNRRDGDWENFFAPTNFKNENPHIALFKAFVYLIGFAQEDLNSLTGKHLEFYYAEVLQLARKAKTPDTAHILFKLANNVESHLITEGTALKAGKDANGKERVFKTNDEIVVNNGTISEVKSIFVEKNTTGITTVYASPIANSTDGIGAELDAENPKWAPFGEAQSNLTTATMPMAELGFAIASDFLLLKEGKRIVYLTLTFTESHGIADGDLEISDFKVLFSGEEDWIEGIISLNDEGEEGILIADKTVKLRIKIPESEKAVIGYDEEVFEENFQTTTPLLKVLINQSTDKDVYAKLVEQPLEKIEIDVKVFGVKDLVLQNETGTLDPAKPFEPFAANPVVGSEFYIGSKEVFSKRLTHLTIAFDWQNEPSSFYTHYLNYGKGTVNKSQFNVGIQALRNRQWTEQMDLDHTAFQLFDADDKIESSALANSFQDFVRVEELDEYSTAAQNGFIRLVLNENTSSNLIAFGHSQYQNIYVRTAISLSRGEGGTLPEEPYTPKTKSLTIDYEATHEINLAVERTEEEINGHFFHINPFGITKVKETATKLIPDYNFEGAFFIGLSKLDLPQNLNILFQVADGSANPDKLPATINWHYLQNNSWIKFNSVDILSDSTNGLINSGIIEFVLPAKMTAGDSQLSGDLYWISAQIAAHSDSVSQLINLHAQAVSADFADNENDLGHLAESLPAGTIAKLNNSDSSIRKVEQPYASFGGKLPETETNYFQRVSERLRHKNRAITIWDYERIVLEEYPGIYKVKCLNHTRMNEFYSEQAPGHVSLTVVSNLRNQNAVNLLQPTTSLATLQSVKAFLEVVKDPFVTLHVKNPYFEEVQVAFNVKFLEGKDQGYYEKEINSDIKKFLSPWAYSEGVDIVFEGTMYKSKIINFIEELDYVDYVTCFKMYHIIDGDMSNLKDTDEISTSKSSAILVSHPQHEIYILTTDDCECDDDNIQSTAITDGIGTMTVGYDLIVNKP